MALLQLDRTTHHINDYILVTISLPTDYVQQLLKDNALDYFVRDYISHLTSIQSHYTLRLNYYQGASLVNFNFSDFTLHYTLSNGYIWDYHLLLNTQQLRHLCSLHRDDSTAQHATHCILTKTECYGHYFLTNTHGSDSQPSRCLSTQSRTTTEREAQVRKPCAT